MKSIAIITDHSTHPLGRFPKKNVEMVLAGFATVHNYYLDTLGETDRIDDDVVMVMTRENLVKIKQALADAKKIILANRTIQKSEIYRICSIPPGTRVLVVNDSYETTMDFMSLLYKLGIDHLDLIPFQPQIDYPEIPIAVTPGERVYVPKNVENVIDTGNRHIDISTFIQIFDMLRLTDPEAHLRLYRYTENLVPPESGINSQYRQLYLRNLELDSILNASHEGILLVDTQGVVSLHNRALTAMLETDADIVGRKISELAEEPLRALLARSRFDDELVRYRDHFFMVTGRLMEHYGQQSGTYYHFRDITYIQRLEQNLNKKLKASGFLPQYGFEAIRTAAPLMRHCLDLARRYAASGLPVFISGESGTGKELFAHAIHAASERRKQPFVAFNCAAVPESLIESELFGYETGSFTGALKGGKIGLFEQADQGTIFLDEIGDMPYLLQSKLLRVLQEQQVMRVGSQKITAIDVRVISATNQDREQRMRQGEFREDLYYRLNVLPLVIPPLRRRPEDILHLLTYFMETGGKPAPRLSEAARDALLGYAWPGNIRELRNVAAYISFFSEAEITLATLPDYVSRRMDDFGPLLARFGDLADGDPAAGSPDIDVLRALADLDARGRGAGRGSLSAVLAGQGRPLSEGRIRGLLDDLRQAGLTVSGPGRGGTRLTARGTAFLN